MIFWFYPSLGGFEYVSMISLSTCSLNQQHILGQTLLFKIFHLQEPSCRWLQPESGFFPFSPSFGCGSVTNLTLINKSGDPSSLFCSSSSIFNVEWGRATLHIHDPNIWDNNSRDQFEMVIGFYILRLISHAQNKIKMLMWFLWSWRYLDVAGMKRSKAYLVNGVAIFVSWLVGQIIALSVSHHSYHVICGNIEAQSQIILNI